MSNEKPQTKKENNVIDLSLNRCKAEGCKKKPSKADFCEEHYEWFKAGLITKDGSLAKDFDKKHQQWVARHSIKKVA